MRPAVDVEDFSSHKAGVIEVENGIRNFLHRSYTGYGVEGLEEVMGFPHEINIDGLDPSASHVLMFDGDLPIATARLTISAEGVGRMARIAMLPAYRGRGLGAHLVRGIEKLGRRLGVETLEVEPHAHLRSFFRMLGFSEGAAPTPIQGHNLIRMTKRL